MKRITVALECSHTATFVAAEVPSADHWTKKHFVCAPGGGGHFAGLRVIGVEDVPAEEAAHIEEGYQQAERGELTSAEEAKTEIATQKESWWQQQKRIEREAAQIEPIKPEEVPVV